MIDWLQFCVERWPELRLRMGEHILLTSASSGIAILIGIPLGLVAASHRRLEQAISGIASVLQTIPSLAMLALLLAMLNRIGAVPAVIALVMYALLPIIRNTIAGIRGVDAELLEAADGIGMTRMERMRLVELPLALPVIVAGIRTAAVVGVGIATLSAFIGAGGLGQFINRGLALANHELILLGAVPAALLAVGVDGSIAAVQWALNSRRHRGAGSVWVRAAAASAPLGVALAGFACLWTAPGAGTAGGNEASGTTIRVASKSFTEQLILGELMAQLIESLEGLSVRREFDLGGTLICHRALVAGAIDVYAEYTGTALTAVLEQPASGDPDGVWRQVSKEYADRYDLVWLKPFGFDNTYAITVRKAFAESAGLQSISDLRPLAAELRAGWTSEFSERPDGYPGLRDRYQFEFGSVRDLETSLMYEALQREEVDVICAFATDGRIAALGLQTLEDDLAFFPPYEAAPVVRREVTDGAPEVGRALERLAGRLDPETMRRLNFLVDGEKHRPADVARDFLRQEELLE